MPNIAKDTKNPGRNQKIKSSGSFYSMAAVMLLTLLADQASKMIASAGISPGSSVVLIENVFHLTLVHNTGAVFGLFRGRGFFLIISSAVFLILFFRFYRDFEKTYPGIYLPAGLIGGGAAGNMVDRLRFGYVIDFLDFRIWPVFNLADSAITIGVAAIILTFWRKK